MFAATFPTSYYYGWEFLLSKSCALLETMYLTTQLILRWKVRFGRLSGSVNHFAPNSCFNFDIFSTKYLKRTFMTSFLRHSFMWMRDSGKDRSLFTDTFNSFRCMRPKSETSNSLHHQLHTHLFFIIPTTLKQNHHSSGWKWVGSRYYEFGIHSNKPHGWSRNSENKPIFKAPLDVKEI